MVTSALLMLGDVNDFWHPPNLPAARLYEHDYGFGVSVDPAEFFHSAVLANGLLIDGRDALPAGALNLRPEGTTCGNDGKDVCTPGGYFYRVDEVYLVRGRRGGASNPVASASGPGWPLPLRVHLRRPSTLPSRSRRKGATPRSSSAPRRW